jgi:hypothetical protein
MRKLVYTLIGLFIIACTSDDDGINSLSITVDETTPSSASIQWTVPSASEGQTIRYQILLNGAEIEDNYASRSYKFTI